MVKSCCVEGCKAPWRPDVDISFFSFPNKNEELRKKWLEVIPTTNRISKHSGICSAHFDESQYRSISGKRLLVKNAIPWIFPFDRERNKQILKLLSHNNENDPDCANSMKDKWVSGAAIPVAIRCTNSKYKVVHIYPRNQVLLQRPRLEETAVPTLFGDAALTLPSYGGKIDLKSSRDEANDQSLNVYHEVVIDPCHMKEDNSDEIPQSPNPKLNDTEFESIDEFHEERCNSSIAEIVPPKPRHELQVIDKSEGNSQTIDMAAIHLEHNYTDKCLSDSELTCTSPPRIATKTTKTALPKSWNVKEEYYRGVSHMIFMFTIDRKVNGIEAPMVQRYVMINSRSANIRYFVHGVEVKNINSEILPNVLRDLTLLPAILTKFQRTRICQGFGDVETHLIDDVDAYRDVLNDWRHKQCTLLSENKKCEYCRKFRKILVQRQARARIRLVNGMKLQRTHNTFNDMDQQKLNALRAKLNVERRIKNRALLQVKKLHEILRETRNRITEIEGKSFEAKFHELGIDEAQKLTLNEIIAAAKGSPQSRRYSNDWINLCKSMNVKSPEVYEFLRSSNIIPLPCAKTIRKYYSKESVMS